jgi:hypothetical protein
MFSNSAKMCLRVECLWHPQQTEVGFKNANMKTVFWERVETDLVVTTFAVHHFRKRDDTIRHARAH